MKTFIFLCCTIALAMGPNTGFSQDAKIVIDSDREVTVDQVFDIIKRQTDFTFIYRSDLFKNHPKVQLKKGTVKVGKLLEKSLSTKDFVFNFDTDNITIREKTKTSESDVAQETFPISGTVTDEYGTPVPGVSVFASSNDPEGKIPYSPDFVVRGTASDFDGNFTIEVSMNDYLSVSGLGFEFYTTQITSRQGVYNIVLKESQSRLDEVVVVGYGQTKRTDLTGSVATVKAKDIVNTQPASLSVDQILGGQLAGVSVAQTGSRPGQGAIINIRGQATVRGANQPLYVIDGIPILVDEQVPDSFGGREDQTAIFSQQNPLLSLNPNDIESVDVLKDASAAAIYGSRAANGVILITTKKGKKNRRGTFNVDYNISVQSAIKEYELMDRAQFIAYQNQIAQNTLDVNAIDPSASFNLNSANVVLNNNRRHNDFDPTLQAPYFGTGESDWVSELFNDNAINQSVGVNYSGGTDRTTYYASLNYADQEGINKGTDFKNYSVRLNVDSDVYKGVKIGTNIAYSRNESLTNGNGTNYRPAFFYQPTFDVFNPDGTYTSFVNFFDPFTPSTTPTFNPASNLEIENENSGNNFTGSAFIEVELLKGLKWKSNYNVGILGSDSRSYSPVFLSVGLFSEDLSLSSSESINTTWAHTLSYNNTFADKHAVDAVVGMSFEQRKISQNGIAGNGFANDVFNNINAADNILRRFEDQQTGRLNSYFLRTNYNFDQRYYLTFTGRADGSTKFGPNNKWGFFPSGAVMWRISNENFLKDNATFSDLRLRASYGRTGLANLPEFQFRSAYQTITGASRTTYDGTPIIVTNGIPNADLQWETTDQLDLALQFGLFNNKVTGSINYYDNKTKGLLLFGGISPTTGFATQLQNAADITNTGWEVELGTNLEFGKFRWNTRFNVSANRNTLDRYNGGFININGSNPNTVQEGEPLGSIFGYEVEGIFQTPEEIAELNANAPIENTEFPGEYQDPFGMSVGNYRLKDQNGDGQITAADRKILGSVQPDFFGGWNNTFTYKGFDLTANFQFSQGGERVFQDNIAFNLYGLDRSNIVGALDNTWSSTNTGARYESAIFSSFRSFARERDASSTNGGELDVNVFSTDYIRLKTVRLGYNLPTNLIDTLGISNINLYVVANNVFTISDWPGLDPEVVNADNLGGNVSSLSTDSGFDASPLTRTWSLGVRVGF
ncbi:SusC/RagA family TonB-linked outer membrane protein [Maribacter sp. 2304DJ31-5]|uniref:SusC/RagA family TonB-linked outer membrane protein n=1 Tax=Maribacter sp. 2304DJ31-5 TaxID=3386273 RepID=UPI0039BCC0DB